MVQAQTAREDFKRNIDLAGDNYTAYQGPQKGLTKAPKGYEPCYISHYGRHGSRWLIGKNAYDRPVQVLSDAEKDGMLTERGKMLLVQLKEVQQAVQGRLEELTQLGAEQHQGIAQRMFDRFPTLFTGNVHVDAKSSIVIRCILSMSNEVMELKAKNPKLDISMDASAGDMKYIIMEDKELNRQKMPKGSEAEKAWNAFRDKHYNPQRVLNSIFSSEDYWRKNIKDPYYFVVDHLWKICVSMQGTELRHTMSLYDLFTEDELYNIWLCRNANWYITYGPSPLNGGTQIYAQRNLIKKMIEEADAALTQKADGGKRLTANLRFGHEVVVMPTVCFLNLNGYGKQYDSLDEVEANEWYDYRIFPMGSNIQFIFYKGKKASDDTLVQILLNEDEATIPDLQPVTGCFYKWQDIRKYCLDKLRVKSEE
ncbi:MAG: histidine-type phosphatase [Prevotella sp.]|nr:histidine-type phosphatase [Candidatus Prevotella equi]